MKTKPLWAMLSGPPEIELLGSYGTFEPVRLAKLWLPIGKTKVAVPMTQETADKIQRILSLEIVDYGNH